MTLIIGFKLGLKGREIRKAPLQEQLMRKQAGGLILKDDIVGGLTGRLINPLVGLEHGLMRLDTAPQGLQVMCRLNQNC